jgi:hypothetical protein
MFVEHVAAVPVGPCSRSGGYGEWTLPLDTSTTRLHTSAFGAEAPRWLLFVLIPGEAVDSKRLCRWTPDVRRFMP